jgi:hypothetical protein
MQSVNHRNSIDKNGVYGAHTERGIGVRFEIPTVSNAYLKSPIIRSCPSIAKINGLGWHPKIGTAEGFVRTIRAFL